MEIRVVNPNTTASMTRTIEASARAVAGPGTRVEGVTSSTGPPSIESHYDEALAVPGLLSAVAEGEAAGADGYVVACFGDPGLDAARELAAGPVVGIAEAAMHTATFLGRTFSIVTTLERTVGRAEELLQRYGFAAHCRSVLACEVPVLELETSPDARKTVLASCRTAAERDRADVVVLGCAGMADLCAWLSGELGVPVVDGVAAATLQVQSLVTMGLRTSALGEYARPPVKPYVGALAAFGLQSAG